MRFEIHKSTYRKLDRELGAGWYSDEKYRVYKIYDTKTKKWITTDEFIEISKEKEIKVK
tara:strand:- start:520 stop:696 length:177 start_codon:yes stop_codon:yes gene_type:complete